MSEVVILGAGAAGLAAAWRLAEANVQTVVIERESSAGGLCRGSQLSGASFDIGPHVFKPRTVEVGALWDRFCDADYEPERQEDSPLYHEGGLYSSKREIALAQPWRTQLRMAAQLLGRMIRPRPVRSSEDWLVNVRGEGLFDSIYRSREEKLWGRSLGEIDAAWYAAQSTPLPDRLGGALFGGGKRVEDIEQSHYYSRPAHPRGGSGRLYARLYEQLAASSEVRFLFDTEVASIEHLARRVESVTVRGIASGETHSLDTSHCISSISLRGLVECLSPELDAETRAAAARLAHRDLLVVNLVVDATSNVPYDLVHPLSSDVSLFRVTNFGNLSAAMRSEEGHQPICVEYNCARGDELWGLEDSAARDLAIRELIQMGLLADQSAVLDAAVSRHREAYPVHSLDYRSTSDGLLERLRDFDNLQSIGRNGMFTYNQMSHSVECGLLAAENALGATHTLSVPPVFDLPF
ncbi:MAG: FAD-dependent oxidoreductase [Myxococcota bacterium]|nr:FAD-dependent oxidoreductase [Myxococcota bacterium]